VPLRKPRWRHPELQPGWIDRPHQTLALGELPLESGEVIRDFEISYVVHGTRSRSDDNVILVLTAIGSTHHRLDFLIGPGRPLDPERHFIICADAIGNGLSTSPSSSQTQPDLSFPRFSIRDMVASQRTLLDALGVERLASVVGASMGGMQALQWGVSQPDRMRSVIALVPMARTRPWSVAMNEIARRILRADPAFPSGPYGAGFEAWAALTRVITNREPGALEGIAAAAIPGLVDQAIETARSMEQRVSEFPNTSITQDALIRHYLAVADASPVPVILYSMPDLTGITIEPETAAYLSKHGNILGMKDSSADIPKFAETVRLVPEDFAVMIGNGTVLCDALQSGARGGSRC
jgi:homoserine O-acetyltransferase